jgi:drug/metabolite transporter (DMT)-like permease
MGQLDNLSGNERSQSAQGAETILRLLSNDLEVLRHKLSSQLSQDIARLEAHKERLMSDIEALEAEFEALKVQHEQLQADHSLELSDQQQAQQQLWAKRLAQVLATQLHARLSASLTTGHGQQSMASLDAANQRLVALDTTIHSTLQTLQQDLNSYHSTLSQQISRMHSMEQQGEAILEALVNRLSQQLQVQMANPAIANRAMAQRRTGVPLPAHPQRGTVSTVLQSYASNGQGSITGHSPYGDGIATPHLPPPQGTSHPSHSSVQRPNLSQATPADASGKADDRGGGQGTPHSGNLSNLQKGLIFVVLSTLALSVHNVLVGIIGYGGDLFGQFPISGILPLNITNSLMLLWLRMAFVLPLMFLLAKQIHPPVWRDMRQLIKGRDQRPLYQIMASGGFLFMSQVLIYKAISDIGPGIAVTLLFMYPLITVPLAWFLFGDRPTPLRLVVMFAISMGIVFTTLPRIYATDMSGATSIWGIGAAILSSAAFALYLVSMQLSFRRAHPVPVSLLQFCTIFGLTSSILIVGKPFGFQPGEPSSQLGLYIGGALLGLLTLLGYLFNNYGVKLMGAAQASIVASSGPVVTVILAYVMTPGPKSTLAFVQWIGVILVTLGVLSLSLERWATQKRSKRQAHQQKAASVS